MPDLGHELTERRLQALERRVAREYATASKEMRQKLKDYLEELEEKRLAKVDLLEEGVITEDEYKKWVFRHTMVGKRWEKMSDVLTKDMHNANLIAHKIIRDEMPNVYALNGNYATYQIEHDGKLDTGFTLYNHDTAEYLLEEERELMPGPSAKKEKQIAENKDMQWNKGKIQSSVLQGILQGESPYAVAARLGTVAAMNLNASIRYARTMTTNAQNAGRYQAFRRAKALGVDLTIEWQATLDNRTRHEHRMMHGQRRDVDEPFEVSGVKILWPAQVKYGSSDIPQRLIWNCRCTLLSWVKGFEGETVKTSPKMGEMTFEEWQNAKPIPDTAADRKQFKDYSKLLGKDAPKTLDEFREIKYNDPEKWEYTKGLASYLRKYPTSSKPFYDVQQVVKTTDFKNSVVLPPVNKRAYVLPSGKRDPAHLLKRMAERNITDDALRSFTENAKVMLIQWGGRRQVFMGTEGCSVITKVDDEWVFRTAWTKHEFDEETEMIMEAIKSAGL